MLKVSEIFKSVQGESTCAGLPCVFIRLAGCNLNCRWCDTEYARQGGRDMSVDEILTTIEPLRCRLVELTGGEPLVQWETCALAARLIGSGYTTLVETNGTIDLAPLDRRAVKIVDVKCPGSGECGKFLESNLSLLSRNDELKFVVSDRRDFDWSRAFIADHLLTGKRNILFSPVHGVLNPALLAEWIISEAPTVRLQLQMQKYLWPERTGGV
ncbi:MAG: radical SAM protein [Candidatus Aureabacteria bacterium]|nr:radical SAM protein [Candidatus Auribacterota bacterium]